MLMVTVLAFSSLRPRCLLRFDLYNLGKLSRGRSNFALHYNGNRVIIVQTCPATPTRVAGPRLARRRPTPWAEVGSASAAGSAGWVWQQPGEPWLFVCLSSPSPVMAITSYDHNES
jgi:hypothetical protein